MRENVRKNRSTGFCTRYCSYRSCHVFTLSFQTSRQNLHVCHASFFIALFVYVLIIHWLNAIWALLLNESLNEPNNWQLHTSVRVFVSYFIYWHVFHVTGSDGTTVVVHVIRKWVAWYHCIVISSIKIHSRGSRRVVDNRTPVSAF